MASLRESLCLQSPGRYDWSTCRLKHLEKHCRRDVEAVTRHFHLLSVQKVLLSESVGIHEFSEHLYS